MTAHLARCHLGGAVHVAPQSGILACMDLGNGLGGGFWLGITPMGGFGVPNQHLHVQLHGGDSGVKSLFVQSLTSMFNSLIPCQFHASFISWGIRNSH